jgi:hypothetical protein
MTFNLTSSLSLHRVTPYLLGISLGYVLHKTGKNVHISKVSRAFLTLRLLMYISGAPSKARNLTYIYIYIYIHIYIYGQDFYLGYLLLNRAFL